MYRKPSDVIAPRRIDAISRQLDDELLVYDVRTNLGHRLNQTAAAVWLACDGTTTITEITRGLQEKLNSRIASGSNHFPSTQNVRVLAFKGASDRTTKALCAVRFL